MSWSYQADLRPEEIAEIERGDQEVEAWGQLDLLDHLARNAARREQNHTQGVADAL